MDFGRARSIGCGKSMSVMRRGDSTLVFEYSLRGCIFNPRQDMATGHGARTRPIRSVCE